jgi:outer membrane receptor protein involved in Fe transport
MDLMGSYLLQSRVSDPTVDFDCAGYFAGNCGQPSPIWRHRFRATWESNFRLNLSLAWRYIHDTEVAWASSNPNLDDPEYYDLSVANDLDMLPAYNWFDFAASYTFRNGIKLTAGVNNIFDEDPHYFWEYFGIYDPLGRYIFGSVQFNF